MRIDADTLREMADLLSAEDRDEMAIPSYLHRNPALRWMAWRRVEVVAELLAACCPRRGRVMDYGCGTGVLFEAALEQADVVIGVDLVLEAAKLWKERKKLTRVRLCDPDDARRTVAPESVDVIVAAEVLEHIEDPTETLRFFHASLAPTGSLVVSLPTENRAYRFGRRLAGFDGHFHVHNAESLDEVIRDSGFRCEETRWVPMPGPLAIYFVARYTPVPQPVPAVVVDPEMETVLARPATRPTPEPTKPPAPEPAPPASAGSRSATAHPTAEAAEIATAELLAVDTPVPEADPGKPSVPPDPSDADS